MHEVAISLAGVAIGLVFGLFGAGGSAFATPVLSLLGVPGVLAVASPLPAVIPAALSGARRHLRAGNLDRHTALWSVAGGLPGVIAGSMLSREFDGRRLLWLSGVILLAVGLRIVLPDPAGSSARAAGRRRKEWLVAGAGLGVGLLTGLLANGGGFLLVPVFVMTFGLTPAEAAGTSMTAVAALDDSDSGDPHRAGSHRLAGGLDLRCRGGAGFGDRRRARRRGSRPTPPVGRSAGRCWSSPCGS